MSRPRDLVDTRYRRGQKIFSESVFDFFPRTRVVLLRHGYRNKRVHTHLLPKTRRISTSHYLRYHWDWHNYTLRVRVLVTDGTTIRHKNSNDLRVLVRLIIYVFT